MRRRKSYQRIRGRSEAKEIALDLNNEERVKSLPPSRGHQYKNQVATGQTSFKNMTARIEVNSGEQAGRIWAIETARADEGALEDNSIKLDPKLPPTLSLTPEHVFDVRPRQ